MSMARVYLYSIGQKVIVPNISETEDGFLVETAPIEVFDVSQIAQWSTLVYNMLTKGNPIIATPGVQTTERPGSPILEKLHLAKWADFEKNAVMYTIHAGPRFISIYSTGKNGDGTWTTGKSERRFDSKAPIEVVVNEMVSELIKEPGAVPKPMLLLGG